MIPAAIALVAFLGGVTPAFVLMVCRAGVQEGPRLLNRAPTRIACAARRVTGLYVQTGGKMPVRNDGRDD